MVAGQKRQGLVAGDLYDLSIITECQLSPDGNHVAYCIQRINRKTEDKYSNLWIIAADGGAAQQFTFGDHSDRLLRWSPDGKQIAFISNRQGGPPQIYCIPIDGGDSRRITDLQGDIAGFEWSPDGGRLLLMYRKKDHKAIEWEEDADKKRLGPASRRITSIFYSEEGVGFLPEEKFHLWTVDLATGKSSQLTSGDCNEMAPRWSPDVKQILFLSNRSEDQNIWETDLFVMPAEGGSIRKIITPPGPKTGAAFSPDGQRLAYIGREVSPWKLVSLWAVPLDGSEPAQNLTERYDMAIAREMRGSPLRVTLDWSNDGAKLFSIFEHHGHTDLYEVPVSDSGGFPGSLTGNDGLTLSFGFDREQSRLAYLQGNSSGPGEIMVRDMDGDPPRRLTGVSESFLAARELGEVEEIWFKGPTGNDLQGWILKPPGFDPSSLYPAVLEIHGGPQAMFDATFRFETYCLAAQGYVVFFCNPRGGTGYGEKHLAAIDCNWCSVDYDELMAWTDLVSSKPYVDGERLGVMGHSYGGVMTSWIVGHNDRFKAAVTSAPLINMISALGACLKHYLKLNVADCYPWEDFEQWWRQSPLKYAGSVKTPTMIMVGEEDLACPVEQAAQFYLALQLAGVDTELILFPGEDHSIARLGRTDRRLARLEHIIRWFNRYLKADSI